MIAISNSLIQRISRDFSNLSASWPAVAESSTNGRDEHRAGEIDERVRVERRQRRRVERDEDHQRVLVDVVVAGAEELRPEERREAALPQQVELIGFMHADRLPWPLRRRVPATVPRTDAAPVGATGSHCARKTLQFSRCESPVASRPRELFLRLAPGRRPMPVGTWNTMTRHPEIPVPRPARDRSSRRGPPGRPHEGRHTFHLRRDGWFDLGRSVPILTTKRVYWKTRSRRCSGS